MIHGCQGQCSVIHLYTISVFNWKYEQPKNSFNIKYVYSIYKGKHYQIVKSQLGHMVFALKFWRIASYTSNL